MKGDISRETFDPAKHYASVRMQQGRVQLDADWNEQADIVRHRADATTQDVVGVCGAPVHDAGFHLVLRANKLTADEQELSGNKPTPWLAPAGRRDFYISAGRLYVDGILVENDRVTTYLGQGLPPGDLPNPPGLPDGVSLVYLDVWQRHLTALDDPQLREIALGGPDTATRLKTVWQVRSFQGAAETNCDAYFQHFVQSLPQRDGTLAARAAPPAGGQEPCVIPPSAGYRGLENQLYRVEVHKGGAATNLSPAPATIAVTALPQPDQLRIASTVADPVIVVGQLIEVFRSAGDAANAPMSGILVEVTDAQPEGQETLLTLNREIAGLSLDDSPKVRTRGPDDAWFKWSRDNGSVVTKITKIAGDEITVDSLGQDDVLGFRVGDWVEITDDAFELNAIPAQIAQIKKVDETTNVITVRVQVTTLGGTNGVGPARNPKLRRWDGIGAVKRNLPAGEDFQELEDGVQARFSEGNYVPGDYWRIPARTATAEAASGNVLWPQDDNGPALLPPEGIKHHYCPLGVITVVPDPDPDAIIEITEIEDCRELFPPLTAMTNLLYVGGDGQTGTPDPNNPNSREVDLGAPLQVRVVNGSLSVPGAKVRFRIPDAPVNGGNGQLAGTTDRSVDVTTDANGLASCEWQLEGAAPHQICEARLLTGAPAELPHQVVRFSASLNRAIDVSFDPKDCPSLADMTTVQAAIEALCERGHGEGCCITVGGQGMFVELKQALQVAADSGWRNVCFCLLPAEQHVFPAEPFFAERRFDNVTISGLKSGSMLKAEGRIAVQGLASLTLRELEITGEGLENLIDVAETGWLVIDKCRLANTQAEGGSTTLKVSNCARLTIVDSEIECHVRGSDPDFDLFRRLPREVVELIRLAQQSGDELNVDALEARVRRWPRGRPQALARELLSIVGETAEALGEEAGGQITKLANLIEQRDLERLRDLLPDVVLLVTRRPSRVSGAAVQLLDGRSHAWLERNIVRGPLTLYGGPGATRLSEGQAQDIVGRVKETPVPVPTPGQLHLTGNVLQQVVFGEEWVKQVTEGFSDASFDRLFHGITAIGNVFAAYENELMAETVVLASNTFQKGNERYSGIVVAASAAFTGNVAEMQTHLVAAATNSDAAANLRMTIEPITP